VRQAKTGAKNALFETESKEFLGLAKIPLLSGKFTRNC
jgi:hypothetical protein